MAGTGVLELPIRWAKDQPVTSREAGVALAAFGVAYGLMQVPGGVITRKIGSVRALQAALVVTGASWTLSLADQWWLIAVSRAIYGGAAALTFPAGLLLLRERVDSSRLPAATAGFASFWAAGMAMVAVVGSSQALTGVMIAAAVVTGLILLRAPWPGAVVTGTFWPGWPSVREMLALPGVRLLLIALPGAVFSQQAVFAWGPRVAGGGESASIATVGLLMAAALAGGTWVGRMLTAVFRAPTIVVVCPLLTGLLVVALAFAPAAQAPRMVLITAIVVASVLSWTPGLVGVLRDVPRPLQPLATSIINQAAWFISSLSPLLLGLSAAGATGLPTRGAWIAVGLTSVAASIAGYALVATEPRAVRPRQV
jgi:MFS family permease